MAARRRPCRAAALGDSVADALLLREHAWVPALAPRLPLAVPVPQRLGAPSERFPRPWLVTTWVRGSPPTARPRPAPRRRPMRWPASCRPCTSPPRPGRRSAWTEGRAAGRQQEGFRPVPQRGGRARADCGAGRRPRRLGRRRRRAGLGRSGDLAARGPAPGQRPDRRRHLLRSDRLRRAVRRRPGLGPGGRLDPAAHRRRRPVLPAYRPAARAAIGADGSHGADAATRRRARGLAVIKALVCILIGDAGEHGRPGGKPTWGPPGHAALQRLTATRQQTRDDPEAEAK